MAIAVGHVEVEIFARYGGKDHPIGVVHVPVKVNASAVIREAQAAMNGDPTPEPVAPDAAALAARVQATKTPTDGASNSA